ncbi:MAG: hypothetical protein BJ554DRAFT_2732 [Olpidium bornovanus]|uniref:Rho-GAP domain-containing protein n=1 Tax=Olpidium bornovanus TaxID=278681 RepID=A0A8H8DGQ4_9FUNG|nr:MAG: hypothetical protein BJ554DRAFT_2732 [Olpidium bornovanus]
MLARITENKHMNLMNAHNLGVCVGPNLLRDKPGKPKMSDIADAEKVVRVVEEMIEIGPSLFGSGRVSSGSSPAVSKVAVRHRLRQVQKVVELVQATFGLKKAGKKSGHQQNQGLKNLQSPKCRADGSIVRAFLS